METPPQQCSRTNRAGQPQILPPPIQQVLSSNPLWESVCERMGYNPNEWQGYHPKPFDMEGHHRLMEEVEAEQTARRAEYNRAFDWVVSVARYGPNRIREALGLRDCADPCNCECCYA